MYLSIYIYIHIYIYIYVYVNTNVFRLNVTVLLCEGMNESAPK